MGKSSKREARRTPKLPEASRSQPPAVSGGPPGSPPAPSSPPTPSRSHLSQCRYQQRDLRQPLCKTRWPGGPRGGSRRPVLAPPEWAAPFLIKAFLGRVVVASRGDARLRHRAQPPHRLRHPERLRPARPDGTAATAGPRARRRQEQPCHCPCRLPAPRPLHRCGAGAARHDWEPMWVHREQGGDVRRPWVHTAAEGKGAMKEPIWGAGGGP